MDVRVKFQSTDLRDGFAKKYNLSEKVGDTELDVTWHFLNDLKADNTVTFTQLTTDSHDFIVSGDKKEITDAKFEIKQELSNGFLLVSTNDGLGLFKVVTSLESVNSPLTWHAPSTIDNINIMPTVNAIDPTLPENQWARIRIASRYRPLLTSFTLHDVVYQSVPELIIMDSGINFSHDEFQYSGITTEDLYALPVFNGDMRDRDGHGTAVASMAVGKNLGVSFNCKLVNVKVGGTVDGTKHMATVLELGSAIDAILERVSANPNLTRVVNMSWGLTPRSAFLESKVQSLVDAGLTVICAAGNYGINVDLISPAGMKDVLTVGSIDKYDIPSGFNDIAPSDANVTTGSGKELNLFAPGENVVTANFNDDHGYGIVSGTSFSSPLVAGIATEIASMFPGMVPADQLKSILIGTCTKHALLFEDGKFTDDQNNLAYLFTSDPNGNYKTQNMTTYVGVNANGEPIVFDIHSSIDTSILTENISTGSSITYSIVFNDSEIEKTYSPFVAIDSTTGIVTITDPNPTVVLAETEKLKMVEFTVVADAGIMKLSSTILFFFHLNPLFKDTADQDVTLALTETNSISFFAAWTKRLK